MNSCIETLNHWGDHFLNFAWPMLWQSSLLIATIFVLDFALRRKIRAAIRYALWLVVLVKLLLPPSLALPTSVTWWLPPSPQPPARPQTAAFVVNHGDQSAFTFPLQSQPSPAPIPPKMSAAAWSLAASGAVSAVLLAWLLFRWRQINQKVRRATASEELIPILHETRRLTHLRPGIRLKLTDDSMSPAVCGLFRPVILLPQSLVEKLSAGQLRAVLLHEAIHLRRGDVWVNCAQALLQIFYWWHPLLWLANARIRRVREEAVDDAVMLALRDDAEIYAPTLLEVAKLAFNRPLASLGLVGILESRSALRQRIERLVDFNAPKKAGLTIVSILGILVFSAVALPMGEPPEKTTAPALPSVRGDSNQTNSSVATTDNLSTGTDDAQSQVTMVFRINQPMKEDDLKKHLLEAGIKIPPTVLVYTDDGILLVRGSEEQQDLIERVALKLNGVSPKEVENIVNHSSKQKAAMTGENPTLTNLEMRVFKINTNVFYTALRKLPGLQTNNVPEMAKSLFSKLGVDLTAPGRSMPFNDRLGLLFVKATPSELDTIERIVQALNQFNPEIDIKARFIEVPKDSFVMPTTVSNSVAGQMTGILTDPNFRVVLHALEQRTGVESLAEPEAVTTSGRQTQMRATDRLTALTGINPLALKPPGVSSNELFLTEQVECGPVLDVVPYVLSDGYTVNLTTTASMIEFLGYAKSTNSVTAYVDGQTQTVPVPLPKFRIRKMSALVNLWDGQTMILGKPDEQFTGPAGKSDDDKKELLVFVTATVVDPAGNRLHSVDELPFNPSTTPPQPKFPSPSP
jgi:beta-lactamase regulating signal transducer with metallopeptidase domain/type II secretory pathway component GspD/PulD (secretin)